MTTVGGSAPISPEPQKPSTEVTPKAKPEDISKAMDTEAKLAVLHLIQDLASGKTPTEVKNAPQCA